MKIIKGLPPKNRYKVLVRCNTFNQSKYIEDTLNGFAMQQTNFPFLVYVIDDASTDGEQEVLKNWINNHCNPNEIKTYDNDLAVILMAKDKKSENCIYAIHLLKKNLFMKPEKQDLHKHWREQCDFEASCEGDDYWINPLKLQKQVEYFESHEQCGLVYSRAKVFSEKDGTFSGFVGEKCDSISELILNNTIPTLTVMYRISVYQHYLRSIEPNIQGWGMGDYPCWLFIAANNEIYFMDDITAVYRRLPESASHSNDYKSRLAFLNSTHQIRLFFAERYVPELMSTIKDNHNRQMFLMSLSSYQGQEIDSYFKALSRPSLIDVFRYLKYKVISVLRK